MKCFDVFASRQLKILLMALMALEVPCMANTAEDLIKNGMFSLNGEASSQFWEINNSVVIADKTSACGFCLKLGGPSSVAQKGIMTVPGRHYRLQYKVRDAAAAEHGAYQRFMVYCNWESEKGGAAIQQISGKLWQDSLPAWQTRTLEFDAPLGKSAGMVLNLFVESGAACFRDFTLEEAQKPLPPAVSVTIESPCYRGIIFDGAPGGDVISGYAMALPEVARCSISLKNGDESIADSEFPVEKGTCRFSLKAPSLPYGSYNLQVKALDAAGKMLGVVDGSILKCQKSARQVIVDADNFFVAEGRRFFPIGLVRTPTSDIDYETLSRAGFNFMFVYVDAMMKKEDSVKALDMAARHNMRMVVSVENGVGIVHNANMPEEKALNHIKWHMRNSLETVAGHPAVFCYWLFDEPAWNGAPLSYLKTAYNTLREFDPRHPVWINEAPRNSVDYVAEYAKAADVFGLDIYPVPEPNAHCDLDDKTIACVGKYTDRMRQAVNFRKPVIMFLQGFAWRHFISPSAKDAIYPSLAQTRFMAYDAIVHGATGLGFWGVQHVCEPAFFHDLFSTTSELRRIEAVLTADTFGDVKQLEGGKSVAFLAKRLDQGVCIIAVNESVEAADVSFSVPVFKGPMAVWFGDGKSIALESGVLKDRLAPYEVRIYASFPCPETTAKPWEELFEKCELVFDVKQGGKGHGFQASWIWTKGLEQVPSSTCHLRRKFKVEGELASAKLFITADDMYSCQMNGTQVGEGKNWNIMRGYDLLPLLRKGENILAIEASDGGGLPCGVLAKIKLDYKDGRQVAIQTDDSFLGAGEVPASWRGLDFDDSSWSRAVVIGRYGEAAVWGRGVSIPPEAK